MDLPPFYFLCLNLVGSFEVLGKPSHKLLELFFKKYTFIQKNKQTKKKKPINYHLYLYLFRMHYLFVSSYTSEL